MVTTSFFGTGSRFCAKMANCLSNRCAHVALARNCGTSWLDQRRTSKPSVWAWSNGRGASEAAGTGSKKLTVLSSFLVCTIYLTTTLVYMSNFSLLRVMQLACRQESQAKYVHALRREICDLGFKVEDIIDTKNARETECLKKCRLTRDRQQTLDNRVAELEKRQCVLEGSMDGLKSKGSQTDVHLSEIEARILKLEPLLEKRVCDVETFFKRQSALEDSMGILKSKAKQTDVHLCEIEARILKLEPLLADQKKLTTIMERMEREISDLDQRIPHIASADDFQLNFAPKINEKLHHCQSQVKVLEGQVSSLKDALRNNSATETSKNTYKLDSPSLVPKSSTRQAFVPFTVPPHPEDDTSRRCTLQVEEELHKARRSNAPPEMRKKLLKEVLLRRLCQVILLQAICLPCHGMAFFETRCKPCRFCRLHSDKIGGSSEPMTPSSSWTSVHRVFRSTHI